MKRWYAFRWKFYQLAEDLFMYSSYSRGPILKMPPRALKPLLSQPEPVLHASYRGSGQGKHGFITSYLVKATRQSLVELAHGSSVHHETRDIFGIVPAQRGLFAVEEPPLDERVDREYNITTQTVLTLPDDIRQRILASVRHDVREFCNSHPAKRQDENPDRHALVERLHHEPKLELMTPKDWELVKAGKGQFEDICLLDLGLDFSKGCLSNFVDGMFDSELRCDYCYARFQNGLNFLETVFRFDEQMLIDAIRSQSNGASPLHIRLGQRTECSYPERLRRQWGVPDNLRIALKALDELREEKPLLGVMPTKTPEYDDELAMLMQHANTVPMVSIGYQRLENGIVRHGFSVKTRLREALRFADSGVHTGIYVMTDVTRSPELMQPEAKQAMEFYHKHKNPYLHLQFLDIRITRERDAQVIGGAGWDELKNSVAEWHDPLSLDGRLFDRLPARWHLTGQGYLAASVIHPGFLNILNDDVRMCATHTVYDPKQCGQCFMDKYGID